MRKLRSVGISITPSPNVIHRRAPSGGHGAYKGGQFIPRALWESEKRAAVLALPDLLDGFGERMQTLRAFYEQNAALMHEGVTQVKLVPLTTIEHQMKVAVRDAYARAFVLGKRAAGNLFEATDAEKAAVKKFRIDEFQYLRNFLSDIRTGSGVMSYEQRMDMYRAAAREIYWLGYVLGNPAANRMIAWTLGDTEHCHDCLGFSNMGPLPVEKFVRDIVNKGYVPQAGKLECRGFSCKCSLKESFVRNSANDDDID